MLVYFINGDVL